MRGLGGRWFFAVVVIIGLALLPAVWQSGAQAGEGVDAVMADDSLSEEGFRDWLDALREEARGRGISDATLEASFRDVSPVVRVIELDRRQPEFTRTFWDYLHRSVNDARINRGREMLAAHRELLGEIHSQYGVPPRYLIALWGLETNYGSHTGGFRVIDALATLAYDPRRADFFRSELFNALQIVDDGHIAPDAMMGSWAGAMGQMQFMPSTFNGYAVDYTGNGRKDIWGSLPDAFASGANYLSGAGWRPGERWGREVRLPEDFDMELADMNTRKPIAAWSALGVRRANGADLPQADMEGAIVLPQGHEGPAFLVYENFRAIMRWNRSVNYAISVGYLADRIAGMPPIQGGRGAAHDPLSRGEVKEKQQLLNGLGFDAGPADGVPGPRTRDAIRAFQKQWSMPQDGYPSPGLLERLREKADS